MFTEVLVPKRLNKLTLAYSLAGVVTLVLSGIFVKRKVDAQEKPKEDVQSTLGLIAINKKPPGLVNNGNTCFVNSVLQALASMPRFIRNLQELCPSLDDSTKLLKSSSCVLSNNKLSQSQLRQSALQKSHGIHENSHNICKELLNILHLLNDEGVGNSEYSYHPSELIRLLENTHDYMSFREQQDSHELLKLIITCFEDTLKSESMRQTDLVRISKKQLSLTNSLLGYTNTYLQCTACDKKSKNVIDPFYDLSLDILNPQATSLDECIRNFFTEEFIDDVECLSCSLKNFVREKQQVITQLSHKPNKEELQPVIKLLEQQIAFAQNSGARSLAETDDIKASIASLIATQIKQLEEEKQQEWKKFLQSTFGVLRRRIKKVQKIVKAPQILILHLKRLVIHPRTGYPHKVDRFISFKDELILEDTLGIPASSTQKVHKKSTYQLSSIISHIGADNFGHYVTLRRIWHQKFQSHFSSDSSSQSSHAKSLWYLTSDTQIRFFEKEEVFKVPAYILFYERMDDNSQNGTTN